MLTVTSAQLDVWLAAFLWPFTRILALLASAPLAGNQKYPAQAKVGLAVLITIVVAPLLPPLPAVAPDSAAGLAILVQQLVIGLAMGFAMRLVFTAVEMAGELIGLQMGLGFATLYDPQNSTQMPVVGQFLGLIAALAFLAANGHLVVLSVLADSFNVMPIGASVLGPGAWKTLASWGGSIMYAALLLSLPLIAVLLTVNLALGVLSRAAPQLNIFAVGFPVTLMIGFGALLACMPYFTPVLEGLVRNGTEAMLGFAQPVR